MSSKQHKDKIWNLIKDIKVGMLTTHKGEQLHSRPMHLVQKDYDGTLWFFTDKDSEKVHEVDAEHHVCVAFSDPEKNTYVSLYGIATITQDKELINRFWNPFVSAWFPDGKDAPNVALLEIDIDSGEHWDSTSNKMEQLYEITKANITDTLPDMGENQRFSA